MDIPYVPARYIGANRGNPTLIVIHTMEAPEKGSTAESCARYFANLTSKTASAHYCIDNDSIVQSVPDNRVAAAAPGANHNGLQFEHAGYAAQRADEWKDQYSIRMLFISAALCAAKCRQYNIPVVFVDANGLKNNQRGITTHAEVTRAFRRSTHTDPGASFPMGDYLSLVNTILHGASAPPLPPVVAPPAAGALTPEQWAALAKIAEWARAQPVIRKGSKGAAVIQVQNWLNDLVGSKVLKIDGDFGPTTHNWIVQYQKDRGLTADGVIGEQTWARMLLEMLGKAK